MQHRRRTLGHARTQRKPATHAQRLATRTPGRTACPAAFPRPAALPSAVSNSLARGSMQVLSRSAIVSLSKHVVKRIVKLLHARTPAHKLSSHESARLIPTNPSLRTHLARTSQWSAMRAHYGSASGGCDARTCTAVSGCTTPAVCNAVRTGDDCCEWRGGACHQARTCSARGGPAGAHP